MSQIAAIFDLDRTLITRSSGTLFANYMRQSGLIWDYFSRRDVAMAVMEMVGYHLGLIDAVEGMHRLARLANGIEVDEMWALINRWFDECLVHAISEQANERLAWHRDQGHIPVICSASNQFAVISVAKYMHIDHYAYSEWLSENGKLTGVIAKPIIYGSGKLEWMQAWSAQHDIDLARSYFYSDDASDLPLLDIVEHPIAVNPHRSLNKIAKKRGWPILHWS